MSQITDIESKLLALAAAAVTGLTTAQGDRNLTKLPADDFPFCFSVVSGVEVTGIELDQQEETVEVTLVLAIDGTHEQLTTDLEAIRAGILADPTLTASVDNIPAVAVGPLEEVPGRERKVGTVVVQTLSATGGDLAAGATGYELRLHVAALDEGGDSNTAWDRLQVGLIVHHRLTDPTDERAYTEGNMLTHQKALVAPSYYSALGAVREVADGITADAATREGNVISWAVLGFELRLVPGQSAATAASQLETALDATLSGSRLASDYRT